MLYAVFELWGVHHELQPVFELWGVHHEHQPAFELWGVAFEFVGDGGVGVASFGSHLGASCEDALVSCDHRTYQGDLCTI